MHVSLSPAAQAIITSQMARGYSSPDAVIEQALECLEAEGASPEIFSAAFEQAVLEGIEAFERGEVYRGTLEDIEHEVLTAYEKRP
jgi:hypothetical protein